MIINMYKEKVQQRLDNPEMEKLNYRQMILGISKSTGNAQYKPHYPSIKNKVQYHRLTREK